jgi:ribosome assembly protein YihI (activator of Der GTPase)
MSSELPPQGLRQYCSAVAQLQRIKRSGLPEKTRMRKAIKAGKDLLLLELQARAVQCMTTSDETIFVHRKVAISKRPPKIDAQAVAAALSTLQPDAVRGATSARDMVTEHVLAQLKGTEVSKERVQVCDKPPKHGASAHRLSPEMQGVAAEVFSAQARLRKLGAAESEETSAAQKTRDEFEQEAREFLSARQYACARVAAAEGDRRYTVRSQQQRKVKRLDAKQLTPLLSDVTQRIVDEQGLGRHSLQECSAALVQAAALRDFEEAMSRAITTFLEENTVVEERIELVEN